MAFLGTGTEQTKKIRLYRNGDDNFFGKDFVLNPRQCRNYDSFLQIVTNHLQFGQAVRSIHTPIGGTEIMDIKTFRDKADYVAVGNGRFKKIPYPQLYNQHVQKLSDCKKRKEKNLKSGDRDENRIYADVTRGTSKSTPNDVVSIWVYCNGEEFEPARRVVLKPRMLQNWGLIYTEINQHISPHFGAVRCLYSMDGSLVSDVDQLRTGNFYVASSRYSGFKTVGYGARRSTFNVSTRPQHQRPRFTEDHDGIIDEHLDGSSRGGGGGGVGGGTDDFGQMEPVAPSKPRTKKKRSSDAQVIYSDGTRVFRRYKKKKKVKKAANRQKGDEDESSKKSSSNFRAKSPYDETLGSEEIPEHFTLSELDEDQNHNTRQYNGYKSGAKHPKDMKSRDMEGTSHQEGGITVIHSREYTPDDAAVVIQTAYRAYRRRQEKKRQVEAAIKIQAAYRGYRERKRGKKEAHAAGDKDPASSVDETGKGHAGDKNTTRPDDGIKSNSSKMEGNKSDPPQTDPGKSGAAKKEDKKLESSATKEANQSKVPPAKDEANQTPKEPSKEATKSTKKK